MMSHNIRLAVKEDLEDILKIYNEAVDKTVATFDTIPRTMEEQVKWYEQHGTLHPVIVALEGGKIVGWASLSKWSDRPAYDRTSEISIYVYESYHGKGIGSSLLREVVELGRQAGIHTIIARITEGNESSIKIHKREGFEYIGVMKEVGEKFNRLLDVHLLQKIF